jgi:hypothetical protein
MIKIQRQSVVFSVCLAAAATAAALIRPKHTCLAPTLLVRPGSRCIGSGQTLNAHPRVNAGVWCTANGAAEEGVHGRVWAHKLFRGTNKFGMHRNRLDSERARCVSTCSAGQKPTLARSDRPTSRPSPPPVKANQEPGSKCTHALHRKIDCPSWPAATNGRGPVPCPPPPTHPPARPPIHPRVTRDVTVTRTACRCRCT